jgi:hypothetical protein
MGANSPAASVTDGWRIPAPKRCGFPDLNHRLPAQCKIELVADMYETMNAVQAAEERRLRPEADEREILIRVAARRLGHDLARKAYGWAPDE